ncbi:MAG: 2-hydroxyacyl-CoA dehydratase [Chloroflexota bacterium]|nr:2-hydroxyacyl-CoA dehydratase [Chloroflexota bacterium]MDE3192320.1 2-hydroxyacyl-CoA dehydratase [Chloroflexota bacterium]
MTPATTATPTKKPAADAKPAAPAIKYQGTVHELQKQLMSKYYADLTSIAEGGPGRSAQLLIAGNPVEVLRTFDMIPVFPEINALQLAVRKNSLPLIQKAEELGYSTDNCAYVKADIGMWENGGKTPFATIPKPDVLVCNYVGCNVYLNWFEHLAEKVGSPAINIDIPFMRTKDGQPAEGDVEYVVAQLKELVKLLEKVTGMPFDEDKFVKIVERSSRVGQLWSQIRDLTKKRPTPYDAYFDSVTMMAPLYCLRGTEEAVDFFERTLEEMTAKVERGEGALPDGEKFRIVIEGPPPWPFLRVFRDMFSRWGAVAVASTYATVGGIWEFGFHHDPAHPFESVAKHMIEANLCNRSMLQRYDQIWRYAQEWSADALVIHSVKSCRLFSAGQGDMREHFVHDRDLPTLLIESDLEDPRYFSQAQLRNRIDAFFEALEQRRITGGKAA